MVFQYVLHHSFIIHESVKGHSVYFYFVATMDRAVMNMAEQVSVEQVSVE